MPDTDEHKKNKRRIGSLPDTGRTFQRGPFGREPSQRHIGTGV
jgi:hypothetical protein